METPHDGGPLTIVVMGASGDLSKKKTFPSIFDLWVGELLPPALKVYGYARTPLSDEDFRKTLRPYLKGSPESVDKFLSHVAYRHGGYHEEAAFSALIGDVASFEASAGSSSGKPGRIFYFAVPPSVFVEVADVVSKLGQVSAKKRSRVCGEEGGFQICRRPLPCCCLQLCPS